MSPATAATDPDRVEGGGTAWWGLVPAAGVGRRVGAGTPKQYLELAGQKVIDLALATLLDHPRVRGVVVALDPADVHWPDTRYATHPRVWRVAGGAERCHSVLNALVALAGKDIGHAGGVGAGLPALCQRQASSAGKPAPTVRAAGAGHGLAGKDAGHAVDAGAGHGLAGQAGADDWVLVHDAARPCLRRADLDRLIAGLEGDPVGGILGIPVRDTMKQAGPAGRMAGRIQATVPREGLWHAFTPQAFRLGLLRRALEGALAAGRLVTDDAGAVELLGLHPRLIEGHADNIKITRPEDLPLAQFFLQQQGRLC